MTISQVARALFVLLLVVGVPVLSFSTANPERIRSIPRPTLYASAVFSQWMLTALGLVVIWAALPGFSAVGCRWISAHNFLKWTAALTLICLGAILVMALFERIGWWPEESEVNRTLLPVTRQEKLMAALLVAPSAGVCEELLYRGFLLTQFGHYFSSDAWGWAASSVAFGLAHSYQGVSGMIQAGILGALLAYPVVRVGSVYPSMAAHFLIDALLLLWLGRKLLRSPGVSQQESRIEEQSEMPSGSEEQNHVS